VRDLWEGVGKGKERSGAEGKKRKRYGGMKRGKGKERKGSK